MASSLRGYEKRPGGLKIGSLESAMNLTPIINTSVKMPRKMLDALNRHEAVCVVRGVQSVTEDQVRGFLRERHGDKLAADFRAEYLFSTQEP
jgi:hypothetical protein